MKRVSMLALCALAVVVLLLQVQLALADEMSGKLKAVNADKKAITITDKNGKDLVFECAKDAKLTLNGKACTIADFKVGDEAFVTYDKKGTQLIASAVKVTAK
jgi:hypothetical protein